MSQNYTAELVATARAISATGKGILAADESTGTIGKRFAGINVEVSFFTPPIPSPTFPPTTTFRPDFRFTSDVQFVSY
jgi:hypothetical protein